MNRRTQRSAEAKAWQHLYKTTRWTKLRLIHLSAEPLCRMCKDEGRITPATVVDHIKAHKGDETLFWNMGNWQSLCSSHHNSHAQSRDRTGKDTPVIGPDGWPLNS